MDAAGTRTTYGYNSSSQRNTVKNARGCVTITLYDTVGRVRAQINSLG